MRQLKLAVLTTVAVVGFASIAYADEGPGRRMAPAAVAPTSNWSGFYAGGNVGGLWTSSGGLSGVPNDAVTAAAILNCNLVACANFAPGSAHGGGWEGGLQFGYNWQMQNWVVGLEADFQGANANAKNGSINQVLPFNTVQGTAQTDLNWFGTVRARLGYLWTSNLLAYGTGGFAYGRVHDGWTQSGVTLAGVTTQAFQGESDHVDTGWTVGGGLEYWIPGTRFTLGAEYLFIRLSDSQSFVTNSQGVNCINNANQSTCNFAIGGAGHIDAQTARVKLNLKF